MAAVCLTWKCVCLLFSPKHRCWAHDGGLRAELMSWAFLCLWHLGKEESAKIQSWETCSPWGLRTAPLCILLVFQRKHVCWEVASTLDLAIIQPSEQGNDDPGPFSEEMPAQSLGSTASPHGYLTCKLFLQNIHCCLPILCWECLFQGVLIGSLLSTASPVCCCSLSLDTQEVWNVQ